MCSMENSKHVPSSQKSVSFRHFVLVIILGILHSFFPIPLRALSVSPERPYFLWQNMIFMSFASSKDYFPTTLMVN